MSLKKVIITTGDADGIGSEVTAKALRLLGPQRNTQFILWRSTKIPKSHLGQIDKRFERITCEDLENARIPNLKSNQILDVASSEFPAIWVEKSARICLAHNAHALVTAPLSKTDIAAAGMRERGHTGIFSRLCGGLPLRMFFWGKHFSLVLHTEHIPLREVPEKVFSIPLNETLRLASIGRKTLLPKNRKPIAILGLNPHAGESGLIGVEDRLLREQLLQLNSTSEVKYEGPIVPDAAFQKSNWKKYSLYIALYHDQGLIPFKMAHGHESGVHLTLGLPFVRTSVDHGCAKDIFNKNVANPESMKAAIKAAIQLATKEKLLC